MAYGLSNMPATSITHVIGQVALPAYSKKKDDIAGLRAAFFQIVKLTSMLAIPLAGGLLVLANEIILVLYGAKWLPIVPSFMVLTIYGLERGINASVGPLFNATGQPKILLRLTLIKLGLLAVIIYPLTIWYGFLGTSIASTLVAVLVSLNVLRPVANTLHTRRREYLKLLVGPFAATGVMVSVLALAKLALYKILNWQAINLYSLSLLVFGGIMVFIVSLYLLDRNAFRLAMNLFQEHFFSLPDSKIKPEATKT